MIRNGGDQEEPECFNLVKLDVRDYYRVPSFASIDQDFSLQNFPTITKSICYSSIFAEKV